MSGVNSRCALSRIDPDLAAVSASLHFSFSVAYYTWLSSFYRASAWPAMQMPYLNYRKGARPRVHVRLGTLPNTSFSCQIFCTFWRLQNMVSEIQLLQTPICHWFFLELHFATIVNTICTIHFNSNTLIK